jgi:flagellar assembly factor FliW
MKVFRTERFGELAYEDQDVIHLPKGLIGLPRLRDWLLLDIEDNLPLKWLQSLDRAGFGLPVSVPEFFQEPYEIQVPMEVCQELKARSAVDLAALIITTVHPGGTRITGNLLAPLLINPSARRGIQLSAMDESLPIQKEIDYVKFGLAVESLSAHNAACGPSGGGQPEAGAPSVACKVVSL